MSTEQQVYDEIKHPDFTDVDLESITDEDIRQLVIYYATIIRDPRITREQSKKVIATWQSWPRPLYQRFCDMVITEADTRKPGEFGFWCRPADINNHFGIR